jgi:DNA-binding response OmpR family regulator
MSKMNLRILAIDDDEDFQNALRDCFTGADCIFEAAYTGEDGLKALAAGGKYDIVLVDGLLPDKSGVALCEEIRAMPGREGTRILFISSYFKQAKVFRKLIDEIGVEMVLHKPIQPAEILDHVNRLFDAPREAATEDDPLAELREEYAASFFDRLEGMENIIKKLKPGAPYDASLKGLLFIAHKMHGTAGMYGYRVVSETAAHLEELLRDIVEKEAPLSVDNLHEFMQCYEWIKLNFQIMDTVPCIIKQTPGSSETECKPPRVLIVDDDPMVRRLISFALDNQGFEHEVIGDGGQALKFLSESREDRLPDLVILDVDLPGIDGFTILHELKSRPETKGLRIIMLTAHGRETDVMRGLKGGAVDYMSKPFSVPILMERVRLAVSATPE